MRNFIMHLLLGNRLLDYYQENGLNLNEEDKMMFLLGNLVPDVNNSLDNKVNEEEVKSHFCDNDDFNNFFCVPNCHKFAFDHYELLEENLSVFGYFYHLYLENIFYSSIFPKMIMFLDDKKNKTLKSDEIKYINVGQQYEIFDENFEIFYNDIWLEFNQILLEKYDMPSLTTLNYYSRYFFNPGIKGIKYSEVNNILKLIESQLLNCSIKKNNNKFFDESILDVLDEVVIKFGNVYMDDFKKLVNRSQKGYKKHLKK